MWYYVYVLQDKLTKEIYIGYSENLISRAKDHQKQNKNWVLVYYEAYQSEKAVKKEKKD
jgi:predicted GIY-YIG superfamily endonuclease